MGVEERDGSASQLTKQRSYSPSSHLLAILVISCLFLLANGVQIGGLNLYAYLVHGFHKADSSYLPFDWFATSVTPYHGVWTHVIALLTSGGVVRPVLILGTVLMVLCFAIPLFALVKSQYDYPLVVWSLLLVLFAGLFARGVGDWYFLPPCLEPFGIAGAAIVAGMAALAWSRYLLAGVCFGLCVFWHAHLGVLAIAALLLATLALVRRVRAPELAAIWLPVLILGIPTYLNLAHFAGAEGGSQAFEIVSRVDQIHYEPWRGPVQSYLIFLGSLLFGWGGYLLHRPGGRLGWTMAVVAAMTGMVVISLLVCQLGWAPVIHRLLPWRLSPLVMLCWLAVGLGGLVGSEDWRVGTSVRHLIGLFLAGSGASLLVAFGPKRLKLAVVGVLLIVAIWRFIQRQTVHSRRLQPASLTVAVLSSLILALFAAREWHRNHFDFQSAAPERNAVFDWVRKNTPNSAVFAVPPDWKDFRLMARRSVVVDWSGMPLYAPEVLEWYLRMKDLTGLQTPVTAEQASEAYRRIDCPRIGMLEQKYGVGYVITDASNILECGDRIYKDDRFSIVNIQSHAGSNTAPASKMLRSASHAF